MSTRYSLPPACEDADTARGARALAAVVLVVCVLALSLLAAFVPEADVPVASGADDRPTHARTPYHGA